MRIVRRQGTPGRKRSWIRIAGTIGLSLVSMARLSGTADAQQVLTETSGVIEMAIGQGRLYQLPAGLVLSRIQVTDPTIADVSVSETGPAAGREFVVFGTAVGATTLIVWDQFGQARVFTVDVSVDVDALQRRIRQLFPEAANVSVSASGNTVIISGTLGDPVVVRRILELANATGATVINNIQAPSAQQILLHVRFAEVNRSVTEALSTDLLVVNPDRLGNAVGNDATSAVQTLSEGIVQLLLIGADAELEALIRALEATGDFKSLAEPNLVTLEGQEATFLAGGEFPFPVVQSGQSDAITIQWKEFGVRLAFTPTVTNLGAIRLRVAPEVSSLDFANGLTLQGFQIPSVNTRRALAEVEMQPGQHLAIAGLLDNNTLEAVDKIPFLGNLPIIGALFRSRSTRQRQTELLVVVTPYIVRPADTPIPVPTGEPETWRWDGFLDPPPELPIHPQREP